ncbi:MAG: NAD-dependent epimerase/dehydratase family protein [Ignavibacteriaceae bacterium]|nr:NAD-dependent epimerase/dehydratase family protein [Ignavibacteriaceae bacterium]HRN27605.1 NAD-dependent epimerase/dehydratase family protein [Ignavibacteriaceae bacterium]HRP92935.1 NAD-dependent epimerase/dehydratase family protein [Ignavibacteriaceae bacterium]HRQ55006.1 NAD-dependent epimerase/dehydratase family protein [Ignavibacteriaceae bacterium]
MKILVTGATGFVGNYVINELLKYNYQIIATAKSNPVSEKNNWFGKVEFIKCDLNSKIDFFNYLQTPDAVIHLAWEGLPNYKELFHIEKNLPNNFYFLNDLVKSGLKNLTVTGTCLEYGLLNGCLDESMSVKPHIPYSIAKDTLRKYLEELENQFAFKLKWLRLFYTYGVGQNENSIFSQLDRAINNNEKVFNMSSGEQLRDYLPVEKVAEIIVKTAIQNEITGIINCCSGKPISIRKMVEDYLAQNNLSIKLNLGYYPYNDYEPLAFWGDIRKLKEILEYELY